MRAFVLAATIVVCSAASAAAAAGTNPKLALVKWTPLTMSGTGFESQERVVLTLRAGARPPVAIRVRAGAGGGFRASFGLFVATDPCEGSLVVTAAGSRGGRATWKRACRPPSRRS